MYNEFGYILSEIYKLLIKIDGSYAVKGQKEVYLFDKLLDSFEKMKVGNFDVNVIKDRLHQVYTTFDVDNKFCIGAKNPKKREISDLVLIVYSPKNKVAKITFMQSKHELGLIKNMYKHFYAEIFQFYLLKYRPIILTSKYMMLDQNKKLLNKALNPSITSYNIFYNDFVNSTYNMAYYSSHLLEMNEPFIEKGIRKNRKTTFIGSMNKVDRKYPLGNLEGTNNLRDFGNYLFNFNIGEMMNFEMKESIVRNVPNAPEKFKLMQINGDTEIDNTDSKGTNNIDNMGINYIGNSFVFVNTDEHSEVSLSDNQLELFVRLTN